MSYTVIGILLVILSSTIEGFGSVCLKQSRRQRQRQVYWVVLGVSVLLVQACFYTAALRFLAVGAAFAIASLTFVFVALLSRWFLREAVTPIKWLGIALIVGGTALIGAFV